MRLKKILYCVCFNFKIATKLANSFNICNSSIQYYSQSIINYPWWPYSLCCTFRVGYERKSGPFIFDKSLSEHFTEWLSSRSTEG